MGRRSDHTREELREMAVTAARDIVQFKGYQQLTARRVADEIGYTAGTLYHIFHNLEDLVIAVNAQTARDIRENAQALFGQISDPRVRLRKMAHDYLSYGLANPNLWHMAFEHRAATGAARPEIVTRETDAIIEAVAGSLGELLPDAGEHQLTLLAAALWSGVHGVCHLAVTDKLRLSGAESVGDVMDQLVDVFLAGAGSR